MRVYRGPADQLAFAVHAAVLTNGFRLVAVGSEVQLEGKSLEMILQPALCSMATKTLEHQIASHVSYLFILARVTFRDCPPTPACCMQSG